MTFAMRDLRVKGRASQASRQSALRAIVPTIRKGLWHVRSTEARLRSAVSIGGSELSPGACSLVGSIPTFVSPAAKWSLI